MLQSETKSTNKYIRNLYIIHYVRTWKRFIFQILLLQNTVSQAYTSIKCTPKINWSLRFISYQSWEVSQTFFINKFLIIFSGMQIRGIKMPVPEVWTSASIIANELFMKPSLHLSLCSPSFRAVRVLYTRSMFELIGCQL